MKKALKAVLIGFVVIAAAAGAFFMPRIVSSALDSSKFDKLEFLVSPEVSIEAAPQMTLIKKLQLLSSDNSIELQKGKFLDADTVGEKAVEELKKFDKNGIIELNFEDLVAEPMGARFLLDSADTETNIIVWVVAVYDSDGSVVGVILDDETGMLLRLSYDEEKNWIYDGAYKEQEVVVPKTAAEEIIDKLVENLSSYWNLSIASRDQHVLYDFETQEYVMFSDGSETAGVILNVFSRGFDILL